MRSFVLPVSVLALVSAAGAHADVIISAPAVTVSPGSSGSFEVLVTNTGTSDVAIGAFSFDISTASPSVDFIGASTMTTIATYIFVGNSFVDANGLSLGTRTGQRLTASDAANNAIQSFVGAGGMRSLGNVFYSANPSATFTSLAIAFSKTGTSLADEFGNPVSATTVDGQITLAPEPCQSFAVAEAGQ
jgi:hypothetical protein